MWNNLLTVFTTFLDNLTLNTNNWSILIISLFASFMIIKTLVLIFKSIISKKKRRKERSFYV